MKPGPRCRSGTDVSRKLICRRNASGRSIASRSSLSESACTHSSLVTVTLDNQSAEMPQLKFDPIVATVIAVRRSPGS